jgi:hypothetical protein
MSTVLLSFDRIMRELPALIQKFNADD